MNRHLGNISNEDYNQLVEGLIKLFVKSGISGHGPGYDVYQALYDQRALAIVHVVLEGSGQDLRKHQQKA